MLHPPDAFADPLVYVGESENPNTTVTLGGHVMSTDGTGVVVARGAIVLVVVVAAVVVDPLLVLDVGGLDGVA
jgi:hypothetical protein